MKPIQLATITTILLIGLAPTAPAEELPPFMDALFPPELIMRHGREVGLEPSQRKAITKAVGETQAKTLELQWEMQDAAQALAELVRETKVDEKAAIAAARRVMEIEGRVKREHLGLLIRIKNVLDARQQEALRALRAQTDG